MLDYQRNYIKNTPFELFWRTEAKSSNRRDSCNGARIFYFWMNQQQDLIRSEKDQILNLLKKLHEEKKITIILVSHSMEDVADYAQRVIVMNGGQVMYEGDKKKYSLTRKN